MIDNKAWIIVPDVDGIVLIGSDAHFWPDQNPTAFRAFQLFGTKLRPVACVVNGDVFDGAGISRHAPIGWENFPSVVDQIDQCKAQMAALSDQLPRKCRRLWPLGNHDARFETSIAQRAPEYAGVYGVHLKDHFPDWEPCWGVQIGNLRVKHRFRQGVHAAYNNVMIGGENIATGHTHALQVRPFTDYRGTRYGIETGMLSAVNGPQFDPWLEGNPTNWRSGFVVCHFNAGRLMEPEIVSVVDESLGLVQYRGKIVAV